MANPLFSSIQFIYSCVLVFTTGVLMKNEMMMICASLDSASFADQVLMQKMKKQIEKKCSIIYLAHFLQTLVWSTLKYAM